jgi:hypothetical protein
VSGERHDERATQLAEAASTADVGVTAVSAAADVACEFVALRRSNLSDAETGVRQLKVALHTARKAFLAVAAHSSVFYGRNAALLAAALESNAEPNARSFELLLARRRTGRITEAVLQHLDDSETVTLAIRYNTLCGPYDEVGMHEELLAIGTPDAMARDVSALLARSGESEIQGSLFSARAIASQLAGTPSIDADITPTPTQQLAIEQAGVDMGGGATADEQAAAERALASVAEDNEQLVSAALWDCVSVLAAQ